MSRLTNEECVTRYGAASAAHDVAALDGAAPSGLEVYWPQSGERVHSSRACAEIIANYPGGAPKTEITRVVGAEDQWVVTAGNTVMRVAGSGDFWWSEWRLTYPSGEIYLVVDLMELRDGLVHRETVYWAPPVRGARLARPWVDRA